MGEFLFKITVMNETNQNYSLFFFVLPQIALTYNNVNRMNSNVPTDHVFGLIGFVITHWIVLMVQTKPKTLVVRFLCYCLFLTFFVLNKELV